MSITVENVDAKIKKYFAAAERALKAAENAATTEAQSGYIYLGNAWKDLIETIHRVTGGS